MSAAPAPRRRLPAEERRQEIIAAAREVFVRSGLAGARTRDLAAEAGINEALLYRHFSSKEELFEAAVAVPLEEAVATMVERSGEPPAAFDTTGELMEERTRQFVRDLLDVMDEIAPLLGMVLFGDAGAASSYYRERLEPALGAVRDVVVANLPAWDHRDFDPHLAVEMLFGIAWFTTLGDRLTGRRRDRDELADEITRMLIHGAGPR